VTVYGVDRTAWFVVGSKTAVAGAQLADGRHRIEASIRDDAGRIGSVSVSFTVDTVPPRVTVVRPVDGGHESSDAADVSGGVVDETPVSVTVGGLEATVKDNTFRAVRVPLGPGRQVVLPLVARRGRHPTRRRSNRIRHLFGRRIIAHVGATVRSVGAVRHGQGVRGRAGGRRYRSRSK
jgi:hypothetical protein